VLTRSRKRLDQIRMSLEVHESLSPVRRLLHDLGDREIAIVERAWRTAQRPGIKTAAFAVSWLGNGAAYLIIALLCVLTLEDPAWPLLISGLSVAVAHVIYPWTKLACGRQRPFEARGELKPHLASLDKHSFPSGHAMTFTAALLPMVTAFPVIWPSVLLAWLLMAWSRVACAHHYPTDILAGTLLGMAVATPLVIALLL